MAADTLGEDFEGSAQVGDLRGESGEGPGVATAAAVFVDNGSQVPVPVEASPADASSGLTRAGWVAWRRRSWTSSAARRMRYMLDTEARYFPSSSRVA